MQKLTWTALTLAFALPAFAAPTASQQAPLKNNTPVSKKSNSSSSTPMLLSKTITPDGKTPVQNVKTTLVPDISPVADGYYVLINIPQQRLFLFNNGALEKVYPVAVGKAMTQTNLGEHKIGTKTFDPTWHIPKSIQAEMKNPQSKIPPGPDNPLGPVFVRLGNPKLGLGIHGTNAPDSVPGVRSHGCVRMKSEQAIDFANTITTGSEALVAYEMASLNVDGKNQLWLAAYKDPYKKNNLNTDALKQSIKTWATENKVNISDSLINQTLKAKQGTPVCLSCKGKGKFTIQGNLMSLAWNNGSTAFTTPKGMSSPIPPVHEEMIESGEIEVDVGNDVPINTGKTSTPAKTATQKNTKGKPIPPTPTQPSTMPAPKAVQTPSKATADSTNKAHADKKGKKLELKSTSAFDTDMQGEQPLLPVQPNDTKPRSPMPR